MPVTDPSALREERGQGAPVEVTLSPRLTVEVCLQSLEMQVYYGDIPNHLVAMALKESTREEANEPMTAERVQEAAELQDRLCGNSIVNPDWAFLDEVRQWREEHAAEIAGDPAFPKAPPGKLYLGLLTPFEVGSIFALTHRGLDFFRTAYPERARRAGFTLPSDGIREVTQRPDGAEPDRATAVSAG